MTCASIKDSLDWYFYKGFKLLIKLWIDKKVQKLNDWNILIKKVTRTEAKAKIQFFVNRNII